MSKISDAFQKGKAFIPFITCGDPDLDTTRELILTLAQAGADVIELGIPFSDPTAEGPVIQAANERALGSGATTDRIFDMVATLQGEVSVPLAFMTYTNVLFSYGIERFVARAKEIGISGIILPDVPFEEKAEFSHICDQYGLDFISLIAPNSLERTTMIAKEATGFIYCVSSLGVTGVRSNFESNLAQMIAQIRTVTTTPCAIGFGISTPQQGAEMAQLADGIIVGSAIVNLCAQYGTQSPAQVKAYVEAMKAALSA